MVKLRDIWQKLYPYGIFRTGASLSGEAGLSAQRSVSAAVCQAQPVFLTFDDGPIPEVTPKVLEILDRYKVKATFFMVGENIDKHPEVFDQVLRAGHAFGNHTYNHLKGWHTSFADYMANVAAWEQAYLTGVAGLTAKRSYSVSGLTAKRSLFRPPYGKATLRQRKALHDMGYRLIYWDILTRDYDPSVTPEQMLDLIKKETRPGSIINFHDSLKSNERMLAVLPQAIEWLQQQGYEIKTL